MLVTTKQKRLLCVFEGSKSIASISNKTINYSNILIIFHIFINIIINFNFNFNFNINVNKPFEKKWATRATKVGCLIQKIINHSQSTILQVMVLIVLLMIIKMILTIQVFILRLSSVQYSSRGAVQCGMTRPSLF